MSGTRRQSSSRGPDSGPFSLDDEAAYRGWREDKLRDFPLDIEAQTVSIDSLGPLDEARRGEFAAACRRATV